MASTQPAQAPHAGDVLAAPPPLEPDSMSLFLDLDGTIAPLERTPEEVGPDPARRRLLDALQARLGGRLAVISGRTLSDLDRVLEGRIAALGAVHGPARRMPGGEIVEAAGAGRVGQAVEEMRAFAAADPSLLVEDKGPAASLHFRRHPEVGPACREFARRLGSRHGLDVQEGDMVMEVRAPGPDKGEAIAAFMAAPPFAGYSPVFLGDDLTDEDGFRAARELGGYGVIVGARRPTDATFALAGVDHAREWLRSALGDGS